MLLRMIPIGGLSVAGVETCIEVPGLKLVLDMGRCTTGAISLPTVLVSHGHLDHCGALPHHAALRSMRKMEEGRYIVPKAIAKDVTEMFNAVGRLDGAPIAHTLIPLAPGESVALGKNRTVHAFETIHRVVSQGYIVRERRRRLKPELVGLPGEEIAKLRKNGVEFDVEADAVLLAFSGDTRVDILEREPALRTAETLVIEASFLDDKVTVPEAREMGHIHLDELIERAEQLANPDIVFCHFSARYDAATIRAILNERLPAELRERVRPLL